MLFFLRELNDILTWFKALKCSVVACCIIQDGVPFLSATALSAIAPKAVCNGPLSWEGKSLITLIDPPKLRRVLSNSGKNRLFGR